MTAVHTEAVKRRAKYTLVTPKWGTQSNRQTGRQTDIKIKIIKLTERKATTVLNLPGRSGKK